MLCLMLCLVLPEAPSMASPPGFQAGFPSRLCRDQVLERPDGGTWVLTQTHTGFSMCKETTRMQGPSALLKTYGYSAAVNSALGTRRKEGEVKTFYRGKQTAQGKGLKSALI